MASGYRLGLAYVQIVPSMKGVGRSIVDAFQKQQGAEENVGKSMGRHIAAGLKSSTSSVASSMKKLSEPVRQVSREMSHMPKGEAMQSMAHAARTATSAIKDESLSINESTEKIHSLRSTVHDAAQAYTSANKDVRSALRGVNTATGDVQRAIKRYGSDSVQAHSAVQRLSEAQSRYANAAHKAESANRNLKDSQSKLSAATSGFRGKIAAIRDSFTTFASKLRESGSSFDLFASHAKKAGDAGESMGQRIKTSTVAMGAAIGNWISNAVSQLGDFAKSCVSTYNSASQGIAKFQQIAKNDDWTIAQQTALQGLASSLQRVGVVSAAVSRAGQTQLGTFHLNAAAVARLTPALDDMVAHTKGLNATTQDAVAIGNLMGKVMTGSTTALSRYGVTMTAAQKATLQKGNADQRAATLAKVLEQNYGGVNRALANTPAGKVKQLQNNFAALKATLGRSFSMTVGAVAPTITTALEKAQKPVISFAKWVSTAISGISTAIRTGNINGALQKAFGINAGPILAGINAIKSGFSAAWSGIKQGIESVAGSMGDARKNVNPLATAFELLGKAVGVAGKVIGALAAHFKALLIITSVVAAIAAFVGVIKGIATVYTAWHTATLAMTAAQTALDAALDANPIGLIALAIAAAIAALAALGAVVVKTEQKFHWMEKVGSWFKKGWAGVTSWFQRTGSQIASNFKKNMHTLQSDAQKGWNKITKTASRAWNDTVKGAQKAAKGAQKAWSGTQKWFQKLGNNIGKSWNGFKRNTSRAFKSAQKGAQSAWNRTPSWFRNSIVGKIISAYARMPGRIIQFFRHPAQSARAIWNGVRGFFSHLPTEIADFFRSIPGRIRGFFQSAGNAARSIWNGVAGWFGGLPGRIAGFFASIPGRIGGFFRAAGNTVRGVWNGVVGFFASIPGRIVGFFRGLPGQLASIGSQMINGLIGGIRSNIGHVAQVITGGMHSAINAVKSALGIHSPSTVMRDEIGQWVGKGMAVGIESSMRDVQDSMDRLASIPADTKIRPLDASQLVTNLPTSSIAAPTFTGRIAPIYLANRQPYKPSVTQHVNVYTDHDDLYTVAPILYRSTRNEVIH